MSDSTKWMQPLKSHQLEALRALHRDPGAHVEAATLSMLRKRGLVIRRTEQGYEPGAEYTRTTSPLTTKGTAYLDK